MSSSSERRRLQNRISQRNRRKCSIQSSSNSPAEIPQGTRIRNHIAHLEAQVAATGGMTIGTCEANKDTFEQSNGSITTDSESYDPFSDRLDSTDPVLAEDFQDSTLDDLETFMNDSSDNPIDHYLTDFFESPTDRSSHIPLDEHPPKKGAVLPTSTLEGVMPHCLKHSNPAESACSNDHESDQQLDLDSNFIHHACNCAEKKLGPTIQKRKRLSGIPSSARPSPNIAISGDVTPPQHCSRLSQHTHYDQLNGDSTSLIPPSCCGHHKNCRSCTTKPTMQDAEKPIENITKANSRASERASSPTSLPSPIENGHHDSLVLQAREFSKSKNIRKFLSVINMKLLRRFRSSYSSLCLANRAPSTHRKEPNSSEKSILPQLCLSKLRSGRREIRDN